MKYGDLIFPKAMNLHLLSEILDDSQMMALIKRNEGKDRKERRIILPSAKLLRKCIIYYFGRKHEKDFGQALKELRGMGIKERKDKILELYNQREKEILKERRNK